MCVYKKYMYLSIINVAVVQLLLALEMDTGTQVQVLEEDVNISHCVYTLGKVIKIQLLSLRLYVNCRAFCTYIIIREGNLWIQINEREKNEKEDTVRFYMMKVLMAAWNKGFTFMLQVSQEGKK